MAPPGSNKTQIAAENRCSKIKKGRKDKEKKKKKRNQKSKKEALYFGMKKFVIAYRATIGVRMRKMKIYQIIDRSSLVQWYKRVRSLGGVL